MNSFAKKTAETGRILDEYWTNTGQILDKYWTNTGQIPDEYWTNTGQTEEEERNYWHAQLEVVVLGNMQKQ